ncbi:hypothetical protein [Bradyrhizobium sp. GCM10027635]|uniref:hypothetical protein n=2 Tax=unclassified Bradyrhizobium TaxID=2631580 RepID=UPI00363AA651
MAPKHHPTPFSGGDRKARRDVDIAASSRPPTTFVHASAAANVLRPGGARRPRRRNRHFGRGTIRPGRDCSRGGSSAIMSAPPNPEKMTQYADARRRRLLYSQNDLQQALSACEFLYDCDEDASYSTADLRRFRCFETTLVVAYTRPFTQSRGGTPPLTMKMVGLKLSDQKRALHARLVDMRNTMMAHSDEEIMRMTTQPFDVSEEGETPLYLIQSVFDEGITLIGNLLVETNSLLREVYQAIVRTLYRDLQANPTSFDLRIDSEAARAARGVSPRSEAPLRDRAGDEDSN